jgi:DinB superfamily
MTNEELLANAALKSWTQVLERFDKGLSALSDDQLQQRVAPGRNRIYYLLGHLTAVHDRLLPMLNIGDRLHPELDEAFISNPDGTLSDPVSVAALRTAWSEINASLTAALDGFAPQDWLQKHAAVSDQDFAADPTRNRLAVVLSRTNHLSFHTGQIILAKAK